jgi:putative salt-induced outer membrane protein
MFRNLLSSVLLASVATPAAAALPPPVRALIEAAMARGNDAEIGAVVKFAKETNPNDVDEITVLTTARNERVERERQERLSDNRIFVNWTGEGELGGFRSTGNTSTLGLSAGARLEREGLKWRHLLTASVNVQESENVRTVERYLAAYQPNYKIDGNLYLTGLAQYEHDLFQGYDARYTGSIGAGYRAINRPGMTLDLEAGPAVRHTIFTPDAANPRKRDTAFAGRAQLRYNWQISPTLKFSNLTALILESETNTATSVTALDTKLFGPLSARLSYDVRYESNPQEGRKSLDTLSRATLVYNF